MKMESPDKNSYVEYQAMKKLGDRAFSAGQFKKAIEYYEKALQVFNIPSHPKYLAVIESIRKAEQGLARSSGSSQPKSVSTDGIINPSAFVICLYVNKLLPDDGWEKYVSKSFDTPLEDHSELKKMFDIAGNDCHYQTTWEFVPYFNAAFKSVAVDRSRTFIESLVLSQKPKLWRTFASDIALSIHDQPAQGLIMVVVFGDELA